MIVIIIAGIVLSLSLIGQTIIEWHIMKDPEKLAKFIVWLSDRN